MIIHLFGSRTPVGKAFEEIIKVKLNTVKIIKYSRIKNDSEYVYIDFTNPKEFCKNLEGKDSVIISFMPAWILADFLEKLQKINPNFFNAFKKIIFCSSSSAITKKFAINSFDKNLAKNLFKSENKIIKLGKKYNFKTIIIQPSMVYGSYDEFKDKNFSFLKKLMRVSPFLFIPKNCGKRQPIYCLELANVFYEFLYSDTSDKYLNESRLLVGGDFEMTYKEMLLKLQKASKINDPIRSCRIISIPDNVFIIISLPLALLSTKMFEANLRILADLCNFIYQKDITKIKTENFPNPKFNNE